MIVITTPTGQIGSHLLERLLSTNERIRLILRDPSKLATGVRERVEVVQGSLDNPADLAKAFANADDLFLLIPPSTQYADVDAYYKHFGSLYVKAIREQKVKRVVFVSGTGLNHHGNAGAVTASVYVEEMLKDAGIPTRILHCGSFMENLLHAAASIKATGQFGTSCPPDVKIPWVATKDIAAVAENIILDKSWTGFGSIGVLGPRDVSYNEIAASMSELAGKKIIYNVLSAEALMGTLIQYGATPAAAQSLIDIYKAMDRGTFNLVKRTKETSSPTDIRVWLEEHAGAFGF